MFAGQRRQRNRNACAASDGLADVAGRANPPSISQSVVGVVSWTTAPTPPTREQTGPGRARLGKIRALRLTPNTVELIPTLDRIPGRPARLPLWRTGSSVRLLCWEREETQGPCATPVAQGRSTHFDD